MHHFPYKKLNGSKLKIAVVVARFYGDLTDRLKDGCLHGLADARVVQKNIHVITVPGAFELPYAATRAMKNADAVVCLGVVMKGETKHDEYISMSVANALQELNTRGTTPVIFGVLTPNTRKQALARSKSDNTNKGYETAQVAVEMALLSKTS